MLLGGDIVARISVKGLLIIAVILSLITSSMIYHYLQSPVTTNQQEEVPVIVAKVDIPPKSKITSEMVEEIRVPAAYMQPNAMQDRKSVVGIIAREQIVAGEQITERRLVLESKSVGFTGLIPRDKRAVTLSVSDVSGVAGFVKAGDYVDVLVTFDQNEVGDNASQLVLQNILVLAANKETGSGPVENSGKDKKDAVKGNSVTLAVSPQESAQLALMDEKGKVRLALRPYMPTNNMALTNAVTPKDLVGVQTSPLANKQPAGSAGRASEPQPSRTVSKPQPEGSGIQTIRGTKVESVYVR